MKTAMEVQLHSEVCAEMAYLLDLPMTRDVALVAFENGRLYITVAWEGRAVTRSISFSNEASQWRNRQPFIQNLVEEGLGRVKLMTKKHTMVRRMQGLHEHMVFRGELLSAALIRADMRHAE